MLMYLNFELVVLVWTRWHEPKKETQSDQNIYLYLTNPNFNILGRTSWETPTEEVWCVLF